ncbi:MAG: S41 family peptidase, partial [Cycloclasticus sp.]|nr:S41 family peptidase [Cycloclasticus sp.]
MLINPKTMRNNRFALLMCCLFFVAAFSISTPNSVQAQEINPEWIRWSAISPDGAHIAFTYKGNIYRVAANGGQAQQLTFHAAHDFRAVWSPDSKTLAFASDRYGNFDIFTMDAAGGPATRLTYHSTDELPFSFSLDGKAIHFGGVRQDAVNHRQFPSGSQPELYAVPTAGGQVSQVFTIPAEEVQPSPDGKFIVYHDKKGGENEWRKHHKSAIARDIWIYNIEEKTHTMLTTFEGEDRNPVMLPNDGNIYYLSEESGVFNVHRFDRAMPENRSQLTSFNDHPVRFLSAGGGKLAFTQHGKLFTMVPGQEAAAVAVSIRSQDIANSDKVIPISGGISEMAISPNGKEIAIIVRGEVFVTNVDGSLTKRITKTPWEEGQLSWAKDGKKLYYASERDTKWSIFSSEIVRAEQEPYFYASTLLKEEAVIDTELDNNLPVISPDGKKIAWIQDGVVLKVRDLDGKNEITLFEEGELFTWGAGDKSYSWSADSKWLLFDYPKTLSNGDILLLAVDGSKKRVNLTNSGYYDANASFVNGGKQILWYSNRYGMKSYATSGRTENDIFTLFFDQASWDEFNLSKEDYDLKKELEKALKKEDSSDKKDDKKDDKKKKKDDDKKVDEKPITIDWKGLEDRKARLTLNSASLSGSVLSKNGEKLYFLANYGDGYDLWEVELRTKESKKLMSVGGGGQLVWDNDMENLYMLSRGRISKVDIGGKSTKPVKIDAEMRFDAQEEMMVLFDHVWLRTKTIFYDTTYHGVDWQAMKDAYEPKVAHISNGYELAEVISEMVGELNVSHAGARYSDSIENADATASLGLLYDWNYKGEGLKIAEVLDGGPLDKAALDIKAGQIVRAIDGVKITADMDWAQLLNRKADVFTLVQITDANGKNEQTITMKPISGRAESSLLYKRWVETNRKEVEEKSEGKLGYVHIPSMSDEPYRSIYDDMIGRYSDKDAVVVDTRFNGGGDLVADLAMFFTGEPFLTYLTDRVVVGGEP